MFSEGALRIELHRGSKVTVLDVQYDRALIGSGAHCDVRLAPDEAAIEQLVVHAVGDDEVYAQTKTLDPPCYVNGAPFLEGRLAPTSMLELGSVALCVQRAARTDGDAPSTKRKSSTSPVVQMLGVVGVAIGLYTVLGGPDEAGSNLAASVPPPPTAPLAEQTCPQTEPAAAAAFAAQLNTDAENKRERSVFSPGDGLAAAPLFERAASCYARAGDPEHARDAHEHALQLHERVRDEIHVRQIRLERFVAQRKFREARHQAQLLSALVTDKTGPYSRWLSAVTREGGLHK